MFRFIIFYKMVAWVFLFFRLAWIQAIECGGCRSLIIIRSKWNVARRLIFGILRRKQGKGSSMKDIYSKWLGLGIWTFTDKNWHKKTPLLRIVVLAWLRTQGIIAQYFGHGEWLPQQLKFLFNIFKRDLKKVLWLEKHFSQKIFCALIGWENILV